jgi:crotonobetainyl-CoA:carnitine CoA-transferase CaiB-like acyl-CoA transferase
MTLPLDGIRVLDLSRVLAGPYCTMLLADLGADVVKVERPGGGDETRTWGPPFAGGEAAYFLAVNRSKRSVALDLRDARARGALLRLAARADVVVENFGTGGAERLGAGWDDLRAVKADLVYCSIVGFAGSDRPGYDVVVQAESGLMSVTGNPAGPPTKVGVALVDVLAGLNAATAILAALRRRDDTGEGGRIEVALQDVALSALVNVAQAALVTGTEAARHGNAHPSIAPYEPLRTADGTIVVAAANDGLFARLCAAVGREDLAVDPRFATNPARVEHRAALVDELERTLAAAPASTWLERLESAGVPAGRVRGVLDALGDAALLEVEHPSAGTVRLVPSAPRFDAAPPLPATPPPLLGQHTREVLREAGLAESAIDELLQEG